MLTFDADDSGLERVVIVNKSEEVVAFMIVNSVVPAVVTEAESAEVDGTFEIVVGEMALGAEIQM